MTAVRPAAPQSDLSYNETLAKVFAGFDEPATAGPAKGKKPAGALPGDIPLAGEGPKLGCRGQGAGRGSGRGSSSGKKGPVAVFLGEAVHVADTC